MTADPMGLSTNPFTVLSYVSGPALLTNATALLLLSTSNRFGRAIDRSRALVNYLEGPSGARAKSAVAQELIMAQQRVRFINRALSRFYTATAMFAMATMISFAGLVLSEYAGRLPLDVIIAFAVASGLGGFGALVAGAVALILESRLAVRSLTAEAAEAMDAIERALQ